MGIEIHEPPYDPEFGENPECPFFVSLGPRSVTVLEKIQERVGSVSKGEVAWQGIDFLWWATESAKDGRIILGAVDDSNFGERLLSPVLSAAIEGTVNERWLRRRNYYLRKDTLKGDVVFNFGFQIAHELNKIEDTTGIESYTILVDTGIYVLNWATEKTAQGGFVIAYDQKTEGISYIAEPTYFPDPGGERIVNTMKRIQKWKPVHLAAA